MEKFRDRKFCLLLYPLEDKSHEKALEIIKSNYDYAFIEHDKDILENGEIKKSHTHVVLRFKNAIWNTSLAEELGISENYIERCRNLDKSLMYLIHYNDIDKFQYEYENVCGPLSDRLFRLLENTSKDENERCLDLIEYINSSGTISISDFATYCASVGKWDIFRRSSIIYLEIIKEHNFKISNTFKKGD